jgi:hypothetical protein
MTTTPRRLHLGELIIDIAIVAGSALYVHAANAYPPQGRQIPLVVGWLAIILGAVHLLAHLVPPLWSVTHDSASRGRSTREKARREVAERVAEADHTKATEPAADGDFADDEASEDDDPAAAVKPPTSLKTSFGEPQQVLYAIAWVAGLLAGIYVLGFVVAIPVFFLAYFGALRAWRTAVISAVVMGAVTEGLFVYALSVPLPQGLLW